MSDASKHHPKIRDPRLDFFRGVGMFIILIAHIPWNDWTNWIPARFGFSDAADMFVFCSGAASALAFAPLFYTRGWWLGTMRVVYRVWQVYWAYISVFLVTVTFLIGVDHSLGTDHYVRFELNAGSFFDDPESHLIGLMTLTFIPNYFEILPMYLVILCMIPIIMLLARMGRSAVFAFIIASWLCATFLDLHLVADAGEHRNWFFNPFGWEILFFTSFSFVRGWLPAPKTDARLIFISIVVIVLSAPVACQAEFVCFAGYGYFPVLGEVHNQLEPLIQKMDYGILRYIHFLATAYLAYIACGEHGHRLRGWLVDMICRVGQQTLAVFLTGVVTSQALGVVLDVVGRHFVSTFVVNLCGCAILIAAAYIASYFKSAPWRQPKKVTFAHAGHHPQTHHHGQSPFTPQSIRDDYVQS